MTNAQRKFRIENRREEIPNWGMEASMTMELKDIGKLPDEEAGRSVVSDFVRAGEKSYMVAMPDWILANVMQK